MRQLAMMSLVVFFVASGVFVALKTMMSPMRQLAPWARSPCAQALQASCSGRGRGGCAGQLACQPVSCPRLGLAQAVVCVPHLGGWPLFARRAEPRWQPHQRGHRGARSIVRPTDRVELGDVCHCRHAGSLTRSQWNEMFPSLTGLR
jgi:hypothetical protein